MNDSTLQWITLPSHEDASVNHVSATPDLGFWEARWVQRVARYGIVYVSSHTGCALSCRFCHLTATKQTMMTPATPEIYLEQFRQGLSSYLERVQAGMPKAEHIHVNFMARGEALENPYLLDNPEQIFGPIGEMAQKMAGLPVRFLVSSILPQSLTHDLSSVLKDPRSELYYSLYSVNPAFRKRWLPKALPADVGLDLCRQYQLDTGKKVVLHGAFIAGQNDSDADIDALLEAVVSRNLTVKFNLVRYNPHDQRHGVEPTEERLHEIFARMEAVLGADAGSRIVPRVGFDVKASCGMFVTASDAAVG